jgi:hypothetical protein
VVVLVSQINNTFLKIRYVEYSNSSFLHPVNRTSDWQHLHILGPIIRAVVGDTIIVVFRNNASVPLSIDAHGVSAIKPNEGVRYMDGYHDDYGVNDSDGGAVQPGQTYTYVWSVPESAGPGDGDMSSVIWSYHSHVNVERDINCGLMGGIIVARADAIVGAASAVSGVPSDVNREFVVYASVMAEVTGGCLAYDGMRTLMDDVPLMHSING